MISIRPGTSADFPAIHAVELSAGQLFAGTHMAWAVGETTDPADLDEAVSTGMLWVAEADGTVCGFLLAEGCGEDFHLWEIAVAANMQRQGIGRRLIEAALANASSRGFRKATLTTDKALAWNAPWYLKLGFAVVEDRKSSPRLDAQLAAESEPARRCAMVKTLGD